MKCGPSALPYILGIFFLLPPRAPFLSLLTEKKVMAALGFPRPPLLYTRPDDDFLDDDDEDDDFLLFEMMAVSLPSSSMSISRSRKNACKFYTSWQSGAAGGRGIGLECKSRKPFTCAWFRDIITPSFFFLRNTFVF